MEKINVILERGSSNYSAFIPELPGCIATGESLTELEKNLREALQLHLRGIEEDGDPVPSQFMGEFQLMYTFDIVTLLSYYDKVFTRRALSRLTGINESLLSQYASGLKKPRPLQTRKIADNLHKLGQELLQVQF